MATTADHYRVFAEFGAHGSSPMYEAWARGVASDADILSRIDELPPSKRIATLVFASARAAGAPLEDWAVVREWMLAHWDAIREIALTHETQTNEAARCATLLPAFGLIEGPIALLEVGTSAGLCLYPDRYSYDYVTDGGVVALDPPTGPSAVRLRCELRNARPPPRFPRSCGGRASIGIRSTCRIPPIGSGSRPSSGPSTRSVVVGSAPPRRSRHPIPRTS